MSNKSPFSSLPVALGVFLGLSALGYLLAGAAIEFKLYERSVTVKGLSEGEYPADIVIWPIEFSVASNNINQLYQEIDQQSQSIRAFLTLNGINEDAISLGTPTITDKSAQQYGDSRSQFRYSASQIVTVYSKQINKVRQVMGQVSDLGKQGIVLTGNSYQAQTEYLFTRLNQIKPEMIEQATNNARQVAEKFAADSKSKLGKIKRATQGQFSISARDQNTPHIKKVRVVSTVEYYLSD